MKHILCCAFYLQLLSPIFGKSILLPTRDELAETERSSGKAVAKWNDKMLVNPEELGGYFEGDIRLTPGDVARNGLLKLSARWTDGVIPYEIAPYSFTSSQLKKIHKAMESYHKHTCIRFEHRENEERYLYIQSSSSGCWSNPGMGQGRQRMNLQRPSCLYLVGTVIHELMHAVGFYHEQSRSDRDDYVQILYDNVEDEYTLNFRKEPKNKVTSFGVPYDYDSVMHYGKYAFSANDKPTIVPKLLGLIFGKSFILPTRKELAKAARSSGRAVAKWNKNMGVNPEELGEYFEGDIRIRPGIAARNGILRESARWPGGVIPYEIADYAFTASELELIYKAMRLYRKYTCIHFVPRQDEDLDYIYIKSEATGCWSYPGMGYGEQEVNLQSPGCVNMIGTVIHELMHVVGFYHEQSRTDRDNYVDILYENIDEEYRINFNKEPRRTISSFGVPYDYDSVMHYGEYAFSRNGLPTIVPKKQGVTIGQRYDFSDKDILKINKMYKCQK